MAQPDLVCVKDYEKKALYLLDRRTADYFSEGADDEQTLNDNVNAFKSLRLRPRMLVNVSKVNLRTTILGSKIEFPVCVAPTSFQKLAHPDGDIANGKAAEAMGTCMVMSTAANYSIDELAQQAPNLLRWFQLYIYKDRGLAQQLVSRAEKAGCKALVVTVDRPELGNRLKSVTNEFVKPPHVSFKNLEGLAKTQSKNAMMQSIIDNSLTWEDFRWLTTVTHLPVIAKGVLTGHDAEQAIDAGCSAVYVSNHGARQLDGAYATITALPEVVKAVAGRVEVYMDGGIRKGTDVLKALALGARVVFVGRPAIYGITVAGEKGAKNILKILKNELKLAMQLTGVTDVTKVPKDIVIHESMIARL